MKILIFSATALIALSAQAANQTYECLPTDMTSQYPKHEVVLNSQKAQITPVGQNDLLGWGEFSAKRDKNYTPKGAPKVRYIGENGGEEIQVIVSEPMLKGAAKGYLQFRSHGSDYYAESFLCRIKNVKNEAKVCEKLRQEAEKDCADEMIRECKENNGGDCENWSHDGDFNEGLQICVADSELPFLLEKYNKKNGTNLSCDDY